MCDDSLSHLLNVIIEYESQLLRKFSINSVLEKGKKARPWHKYVSALNEYGCTGDWINANWLQAQKGRGAPWLCTRLSNQALNYSSIVQFHLYYCRKKFVGFMFLHVIIYSAEGSIWIRIQHQAVMRLMTGWAPKLTAKRYLLRPSKTLSNAFSI